MRKMITPAQMRMLWGLARQMDIDADTLHARARAVSGKESLKELTASEAARLTDALMGRPKESPYRAARTQIGMIRGLNEKLGWDDPLRLRGWLKSRWGTEMPEWLTSYQARECIEAMKAMLAGGRAERKKYQAKEE